MVVSILIPQKLQQIPLAKTAPLVEEVSMEMVPITIMTQSAKTTLSDLIVKETTLYLVLLNLWT